MHNSHDNFIAVYEARHERWDAFAHNLKELMERLLKAAEINFHVVEARAKSVKSVRKKLDRPGKSYPDPWHDLPDLAGVRIVLLDHETVKKAEDLVEQHFSVDVDSSGNKADELDDDQFGYLSVHKVVTLSKGLTAKSEWKEFDGWRAEFQIRTVLQHAWASISHKLQYKRENEIPSGIRRRLTRLAGLFELVDDEFLRLLKLDADVQTEIRRNVKTRPETVSLNLVSITAFVADSDVIQQISQAAMNGGFIAPINIYDEFERNFGLAQLLYVATTIGCKTVTDLEDSLKKIALSAEGFFEAITVKWIGPAAHFAAVLLAASNPNTFPTSDQFPFASLEFASAIIKVRGKVL